MEVRWKLFRMVAGWRENIASRARKKAAQERAPIIKIIDAEILLRRKNHVTASRLQLKLEPAKQGQSARWGKEAIREEQQLTMDAQQQNKLEEIVVIGQQEKSTHCCCCWPEPSRAAHTVAKASSPTWTRPRA